MDERKRLELIIEAIKYCQRVKAMDMPPSCYSKALREPIYFLWDCREKGSKATRARYRSKDAIGKKIGDGKLVQDHAIPFRYLQDKLLQLIPATLEGVKEVLGKFELRVLITKAEDNLLNAKKLRAAMPGDWDGIDELARYKAAGIELVSNQPVTETPEFERTVKYYVASGN